MSRAPGAATAEILGRLERFGIKLGLDTTRELLARLGSPERRYRTVLVAGTNGKGSTAALLASMAAAAGYRTGLFTSPHLESVRERLRIDGRGIGAAELDHRLMRVVEAGQQWLARPPSYFEALCVTALDWFGDRGVDLAVLEVGLGGRLDATNVCEPDLSVITTLDFDHEEVLGHAIEEIAREKAGILRAGRRALTAAAGPGLAEVERRAAELGAELDCLDPATAITVVDERPSGQSFELATGIAAYRLEIGLGGAHQRVNAALAARAAEALAASGLPRLGRDAIERGAAACRWPGRLERIELGDGSVVLIDAAHNPAGAAALATHLERYFPGHTLLFGVLKKKNAAAMLERLVPAADRVILTRPPSERAQSPADLPVVGARSIEIVDDVEGALGRALAVSNRVVVCGSLYLIGEVRALLRRDYGVPPPTVDLVAPEPLREEPARAAAEPPPVPRARE